jgi:hypothetical protein
MSITPRPTAPIFKLVFLPNMLRAGIVRKAPARAMQLMTMGNIFSIAGIIYPIISPEYAIMVLIPTICWPIDRWMAAILASGLVWSYGLGVCDNGMHFSLVISISS